MLRAARDSAKAAVEATGSGKRSHAPSMKKLEAGGLVDVPPSPQLMTPEVLVGQRQRGREYKERVKVYKAYNKLVGGGRRTCESSVGSTAKAATESPCLKRAKEKAEDTWSDERDEGEQG